MSKENPFPPSVRKLKKLKKEGKDPQSSELYGFFSFLLIFVTSVSVFKFWPALFDELFWQCLSPECFQSELFAEFSALVITLLLGLVGIALVSALLTYFVQRQTFPQAKEIQFQINVLQRFKSQFAPTKMFNRAKILIIAVITIGILVAFSWLSSERVFAILLFRPEYGLLYATNIIIAGSVIFLFFMFVSSLVEFGLERMNFLQSSRMSHDEMKRERKDVDGNQDLKVERKRRMSEG